MYHIECHNMISTHVCDIRVQCNTKMSKTGSSGKTPYLVYLFIFHTLYTKVYWYWKHHRKLYISWRYILQVWSLFVCSEFREVLMYIYISYISFIPRFVTCNNGKGCVWWYRKVYENYVSNTYIYRKLSNPPMLWSKYSSGIQYHGID